MSWHADTSLFEAYASGEIDGARALSLEAHLLECTSCREGLAEAADGDALEAAWAAIAREVRAPAPRVAERLLLRAGVPDHIARLLAATPSLRLSWFAAIGAALAFGVAAAYAGPHGVLLFLVLAPLVPLAGVAAAYGPGVDPTYEIGLAAPMRSFRLLLIRSLAVLVTSLGLAGIAALALPRLDWTAAAWLLPSLALCGASLALSTAWSPARAAGTVAVSWIATVLVVEGVSRVSFAAFHANGQIVSLALVVVSAAVIARRHDAFDMRRNR